MKRGLLVGRAREKQPGWRSQPGLCQGGAQPERADDAEVLCARTSRCRSELNASCRAIGGIYEGRGIQPKRARIDLFGASFERCEKPPFAGGKLWYEGRSMRYFKFERAQCFDSKRDIVDGIPRALRVRRIHVVRSSRSTSKRFSLYLIKPC